MYRSLAAALIVIALTCGSGREPAAKPSTYGDAMRWYEREAAKGFAKAQYFLGLLYERGGGPRTKDLAKAFQWFAKAAAQGHARAQYKISRAYQFGLGTVSDPEQAVLWYRRAAGQGLPEAQHNLAYMLENAVSTERSPDEAVRWYREAAERGGPSQFALGSVYMRGMGVERNLAEAWAWLRAAEFRQVAGAGEARAALEKEMTPEEMSQARKMANPDPPDDLNQVSFLG